MPKFKIPRALPLIATILVCALGIALGNWQTRRAHEKEEMARQIEAQGKAPAQLATSAVLAKVQPFQRLRLHGKFLQQWPLYLDNRPMNGKAGMYALMPFQITDNGETILVERGWFQRNIKERTKIPALSAPEGEIEIEGVVRTHIDRSMQLGASDSLTPGAIVQNLSVPALAEVLKVKMPEWVLEQTSDHGAGLQRDWPVPSSGADKHRAYAFQWYGLAAMAALFFVVTGIRRGKKQ